MTFRNYLHVKLFPALPVYNWPILSPIFYDLLGNLHKAEIGITAELTIVLLYFFPYSSVLRRALGTT